MKLNQIINLHKGLTVFVVAGLMMFYKNYSIAAWVYLSLHGTYGILWLLKDKIFPDPYFKEKINFWAPKLGANLVPKSTKSRKKSLQHGIGFLISFAIDFLSNLGATWS